MYVLTWNNCMVCLGKNASIKIKSNKRPRSAKPPHKPTFFAIDLS
jgi:hypothetical protein